MARIPHPSRRLSTRTLLAALLLVAGVASLPGQPRPDRQSQPSLLWYDRPATAFEEALPLGNGRTGVMVYGGPSSDRFLLNDSTLWTGGPIDPAVNPDAINWLPKVREALFKGDYKAADALTRKIQGKFSQSYAPLGDLYIDAPDIDAGQVTGYRRELDLATAIARTTFTAGGARYSREAFVSYPDKLLIVKLTASEAGRLTVALRFTSQLRQRGDRRRQRRPAALRARAGARRAELPPGHQGPVRVRRRPESQGHAVRGARANPEHGRQGRTRRGHDYPRGRNHGACRGCDRHQLCRVRQGPRPGTGPRPGHRGTARRDRGAHVREPAGGAHEGCRHAVRAGQSRPRPHGAGREADRRPPARLRGRFGGPWARGPLLPVRPLPAHQRLEAGQPGAEPPGHLEPAHAAAVEQQLHGQHQHRDELLAGGDGQPGRVPSAAAALHRRPREDGRGDGPSLLRRRRLVRRTTTATSGRSATRLATWARETPGGPTGRWPASG